MGVIRFDINNQLDSEKEERLRKLYRRKIQECKICHKKFISRQKQAYCSEECRKKGWKIYSRHKTAEQRLIDKLALMPIEIRNKFQELAIKQQFVEDIPLFNDAICYICESSNNLIKHHISYNPEEIVILCRKCHTILHNVILQKKKCRPINH